MRKTIAGGVLMAAAAAAAFQTPQLLNVNSVHHAAIQKEEATSVLAGNSQKDDLVIPRLKWKRATPGMLIDSS